MSAAKDTKITKTMGLSLAKRVNVKINQSNVFGGFKDTKNLIPKKK